MSNSGHSNVVKAIAFSPDGTWLASASDDSTIKLWDVASGRLLRTLVGHTMQAIAVAITPKGQVVSASGDNTIKIWEAETGRLLRSIKCCEEIGYGFTSLDRLWLSPDGQSIYANATLAIIKWDIATGARQKKYASKGGAFGTFAVSPDGRLLAITQIGKNYRPGKPIPDDIQIIDAATGRVLKTFQAHFNSARALAFSPDSRLIASTGGDKTAKIWDVATGRLLLTLAQTGEPMAVAFSPDGKRLVSGDSDGAKFWDVASGQLLLTADTATYAWSLNFSPDGALLASAGTFGDINLVDAVKGKPVREPFGMVKAGIGDVNITSGDNGEWLAVGPEGLAVWDAVSGQPKRNAVRDLGFITSEHVFAHTADAQWLVHTQSKEGHSTEIWNVATGARIGKFDWGETKYGLKTAISADGKSVAVTAFEDRAPTKVWDIASGAAHAVSAGNQYSSQAFDFGPQGWLATTELDGNFNYSIRIWDVVTGKTTRTIKLPKADSMMDVADSDGTHLTVSPDGVLLAAHFRIMKFENFGWNSYDTVGFWDAQSGRFLRALRQEGTNNNPHIMVFSRDSKMVAVGVEQSPAVNLWDVASGQLLRALQGNPGSPRSLSFSPDGAQIMAGNTNGTTAVWDVRTGTLLVTTLHAPTGEWVTITPEGFFSASDHGPDLLHVVKGFDTTGIEQVYQALYRPDLVREKLAGDRDGKVKEAAAQLDLDEVLASGNAPKVSILSPQDGASQDADKVAAEAEIADSGGGIGKVEWRVNGVTVGIEDQSRAPAGTPIRLKRDLALGVGGNVIEVVAYNRANLVASLPGTVRVQGKAPEGGAKPRLMVLAAGINDYADPKLKLNFAVPDAQSLAEALTKAGEGFYDSVEVTLLRDGEVTRDGLNAAFVSLAAKIKPSDVFVFYVAGHGKTIDGRYYFGQQDIHVTDIASIAQQGIAQDEWQKWFASIPARNSLLLFDTCESGSLTTTDNGALEQQASSGRLAQALGRTILTASSSEQLALEGIEGHGLFTYDLLDAVGRADSDGDGMLEVTELAAFVYAQVSMFTDNKQVPQVRMSGPDYGLVKQTPILGEQQPKLAIPAAATHLISTATEFQIEPQVGARGIHKLDAQTPVTVIHSDQGWVLVAKDGKLLGYVAQGDLAPMH
jgi:WD40 repeat protein